MVPGHLEGETLRSAWSPRVGAGRLSAASGHPEEAALSGVWLPGGGGPRRCLLTWRTAGREDRGLLEAPGVWGEATRQVRICPEVGSVSAEATQQDKLGRALPMGRVKTS